MGPMTNRERKLKSSTVGHYSAAQAEKAVWLEGLEVASSSIRDDSLRLGLEPHPHAHGKNHEHDAENQQGYDQEPRGTLSLVVRVEI
jgi:hypothetical protein